MPKLNMRAKYIRSPTDVTIVLADEISECIACEFLKHAKLLYRVLVNLGRMSTILRP